jgi:serine/threonine protein kinase
VEQLGKIFNLLGTPTVENWPKAELLPNFIEFEPRLPRRDFKTLFSDRRAAEYDLLMSLLQLDPARRPTATEVRSLLILLSDHSYVRDVSSALFWSVVACTLELFCVLSDGSTENNGRAP